MAQENIRDKVSATANKAHNKVQDEKIRVSFHYLDWSVRLFFVHGFSEGYYQHLFSALHDLSEATVGQIRLRKHERLTPKPIRWENASHITQNFFPIDTKSPIALSLRSQANGDDDALKEQIKNTMRDAFELRIAKNYGRIHGFLCDNTFHIVWFDPMHNLFPGKENGRPITPKTSDQCALEKTYCFEDLHKTIEEIREIRAENEKLTADNIELYSLLDQKTSSN
jgi:hypothetical protein